MMRMIVACLAGLFFAGCSSRDSKKDDQRIDDRRDAPVTYDQDTRTAVTDPMCGMCVEPTDALSVDHEGTTYYFCSEECLCTFQENPAAYVQGVVVENEVD